jgi:hypothetical protein
MTDLAAPAWVINRDGLVVPFDANRISQSLFAASELLGSPDAFLARELADSVVHFLAQESAGQTTTIQRIAEVVIQTVRELGQPALAQAFASYQQSHETLAPVEARPLAAVLADAARQYTLRTVYTRDLGAAQAEGLVQLTGLQTPTELAAGVCQLGPLEWFYHDSLTNVLVDTRRVVGQLVAFDGLEYLCQAGESGLPNHRSASRLAGEMVDGLDRTGLQGVVNLNIAQAPLWAESLANGPLFLRSVPSLDASCRRANALELFDSFLLSVNAPVRIDWHLNGDDFEESVRSRLLRVVRCALDGRAISFVFDRPRRSIALAEGLDRDHPVTLLMAGVNLVALAEQPGMLADPDRFLQRLGTLVRLALSAAVQKRDYVRREAPRQPDADVTSGFLLDRARFVLVPVGLDEVVHLYTGWSLATGGPSLDFARRIVSRLDDVLQRDARSTQMEACLDGPIAFALEGTAPTNRAAIAGLTPWDSTVAMRSQLRAGGALHALTATGTQAVFLPPDESSPGQVADWLEQAWRQAEIVRVRLLRVPAEQGQLFSS